MKILIVIIYLLCTLQVQAKCASDGFYVSPNDQLSPSSCLMVEGYGKSQEFIKSLSGDVSIYLESDSGEKITLDMVSYNEGAFRINQALLKPIKTLKTGSNYHLKFDNLDNGEFIPYSLKNNMEKFSWTVNSDQQESIAKLLIEPQFLQGEKLQFGCGPSVKTEFEFITDSDSSVLVKTELMDLTDETVRTYFLKTTESHTLSIGHGMCSGAFKFKAGHEYQARFSIMDDCNTNRDLWTNWVPFDNPR